MRNKFYLYLILVLGFSQATFAQTDKSNYYLLLRKAEKEIVKNQLNSALVYYHEAFEKYDYPFARDITAAACVAHFSGNTNQLYKYIELLLKRGMPLKDLEYFIHKRTNDVILLAFKNDFISYQNDYLASINKPLEKELRELDKKNQIDISYVLIHHKSETNQVKSQQKEIFNDTLVNKYVDILKRYKGFSEKDVGLGSHIFLKWTNNKKNIYHKNIVYEYIDKPDIREKKNDSVFFGYSHTKNISLTEHYTRRGNSFLWHVDLEKYPKLDSLLRIRLNTLKIYPTFYAACFERSQGGMNTFGDYCIGWESASKQKYGFDLKKILASPEADQINKRRAKFYIRSLQDDLALFKALQKLEGLKYKHYFKRRAKGKNLFFNVLFTRTMP